jgi:hypothetical protein
MPSAAPAPGHLRRATETPTNIVLEALWRWRRIAS